MSSVWRWGVLPEVDPVDVAFTFVEVAQKVGVEVHGPDAVRHLLGPTRSTRKMITSSAAA